MEWWYILAIFIELVLCFVGGERMKEKGRSFGAGFALVFFLGIIGIIIINCFSDETEHYSYDAYKSNENLLEKLKTDEEPLIPVNGWRCSCGKVNESYVGTCSCGCDRYGENIHKSVPVVKTPETNAEKNDEEYQMNLLIKYKELFDMGAISEDEFNFQRKRILENIETEEKNEVEDVSVNGWTCPNCQHENQQNRKSCYYCGAIKDKIY